ncbi:zinc-binding dehydrogenase [Streptomyces sp. NBC_00249]|uniref:zinc-binding dehydrogenase n=1 Tax=Streptomyces sp. NBC_00249 TaxID=2975690 RepID=UPI002255C705|nr:zinc-binding dehydrogenase [Streptomyces sp. NBC_00249]MCX5192558.1 zinc-binding dehydrogenase [Streptomyces sp. NBC_00249]
MQALVFDPQAPMRLSLADAPDPKPRPGQALVEVSAVSFNFGEIAYRSDRTRPGYVSGWDAAGVVVRPADDGSGPPAGTRVVTFGWGGAWARLRAVDTAELAVVPDAVDLGTASALPVAGVTALQAVRRLGSVLGRRVLVTGASGGVGRFAVQLAALAGAHVVASAGSAARAEGLRELGAAEIVGSPAELTAPVYGVLDNVGGVQLADAFYRLEHDGVVQAIGKASGEATVIDFEQSRVNSARGRLENFNLGTPLGKDLGFLLTLLESGRLDAQVGWRGPWTRAAEAAEGLVARRILGKAVLDTTPAAA